MIMSFSHQKFCMWAGLLTVLVGLASVASGAVAWNETFEAYPRGTLPTSTNEWTFSAAAVVVSNSVTPGLTYASGIPTSFSTGTNALYIPQDVTATAATNGTSGDTNVWVDMYVMPNLYDGATTAREPDTNASAVFFFSSNGYATVYQSATTNWNELKTDINNVSVSPVTDTSMYRVTVCMDYTAHTYALFVEDTLLREGLAFVSNRTDFESVVVEDDATVDNLWVSSTNYPDGTGFNSAALIGDRDHDGLSDAWELHHFSSTSVSDGRYNDDQDNDGRSDAQEYADVTDPNDPGSATWAIPYYEKFAAAALGALTELGPITNLGGSAILQSDEFVVMSDSTAIQLSAGGVQLTMSDTSATNVFCQLYIKPVLCVAEPAGVVGTESTAICVLNQAADNLLVYSGGGWTNPASIPTVPTNGWLGFAVHLDYSLGLFDLYVSTNGNFSLHMAKANAAPLGMNASHTATYFTSMTITNESTSTGYVDAVAVSISYTNCLAGNSNLAIFERIAGAQVATAIPPYDYTGSGLDGQMGYDLSIGLVEGDELRLFTSNDWHAYVLTDEVGLWSRTVGSVTPANLEMTAGQGIILARAAGSDALAFYPYGEVSGTASREVADLGAPFFGKTDLAMPATRTVCVDINAESNIGFATKAEDGDELLFYDPQAESTVRFVWRNSRWEYRGGLRAYDVCPGDAFVYYRRTASTFTWFIAQ